MKYKKPRKSKYLKASDLKDIPEDQPLRITFNIDRINEHWHEMSEEDQRCLMLLLEDARTNKGFDIKGEPPNLYL